MIAATAYDGIKVSADANPPVLRTERFIMRGPQRSDFRAYADFFASDRSVAIGGPMPEKDAWIILMCDIGTWVSNGFGMWVLEQDGAPVGVVCFHHPPNHADLELCWTLFEPAEGKGLAAEAATAALNWAARNLKGQRLVSYIERDNARSTALAKRLGAQDIGTPDHNPNSAIWLHSGAAA